MSRIILIAVLAVMAAGPATAASFDCKKAKLPAEIAVCSDPTLSSQDEELARQYLPLIKSAPADSAKTIKTEQKAWLAERNACGADMQCIMGSYRMRLQRFGEWRDQLSGAAPSGADPGRRPQRADHRSGCPDDRAGGTRRHRARGRPDRRPGLTGAYRDGRAEVDAAVRPMMAARTTSGADMRSRRGNVSPGR